MTPAVRCECDQAIFARQVKQRRTLREVEIRDALVQLTRELADHDLMGRPLMAKAAIAQGRALVEELDELHAQAIFVREVA